MRAESLNDDKNLSRSRTPSMSPSISPRESKSVSPYASKRRFSVDYQGSGFVSTKSPIIQRRFSMVAQSGSTPMSDSKQQSHSLTDPPVPKKRFSMDPASSPVNLFASNNTSAFATISAAKRAMSNVVFSPGCQKRRLKSAELYYNRTAKLCALTVLKNHRKKCRNQLSLKRKGAMHVLLGIAKVLWKQWTHRRLRTRAVNCYLTMKIRRQKQDTVEYLLYRRHCAHARKMVIKLVTLNYINKWRRRYSGVILGKNLAKIGFQRCNYRIRTIIAKAFHEWVLINKLERKSDNFRFALYNKYGLRLLLEWKEKCYHRRYMEAVNLHALTLRGKRQATNVLTQLFLYCGVQRKHRFLMKKAHKHFIVNTFQKMFKITRLCKFQNKCCKVANDYYLRSLMRYGMQILIYYISQKTYNIRKVKNYSKKMDTWRKRNFISKLYNTVRNRKIKAKTLKSHLAILSVCKLRRAIQVFDLRYAKKWARAQLWRAAVRCHLYMQMRRGLNALKAKKYARKNANRFRSKK
jgi:hypothetical protein